MISLKELTAGRILIGAQAASKKQILEQLVGAVCAAASLQPGLVLEQILQREQQMPTTLDTGLAIPHIRLEELEQAVAALAILPQAIVDTNGKKMRVVFLFLSPGRPEFFQQHLQLLARVAEVFKPGLVAQLSQMHNIEQAQNLLEKHHF